MEKELLQRALDSILHGSTQIISRTDQSGNLTHEEIRINDLRIPLVEKLASKLVQTEEFRLALEKAFTAEVIKKIQSSVLEKMVFNDLGWSLQEKIRREVEQSYGKVELRKYRVVAEVVDDKS